MRLPIGSYYSAKSLQIALLSISRRSQTGAINIPITKVGNVSVAITAEGSHSKKREREKHPVYYSKEQYLRSNDQRGNGDI